VASTLSPGAGSPGFFEPGFFEPGVSEPRVFGAQICHSELDDGRPSREFDRIGATFRISETLAEGLRPDVSRKNKRDGRGCGTGGG
jgi:hypothetical protein